MVSSNFISGLLKSTESLNRQFVGRTDVINVYRIITENIDINQGTLVITEVEYTQDVPLYGQAVYGTDIYYTPVMIWGSLIRGTWGQAKWSAGLEESFILGHGTYGMLGSATLGGDPITTNIIRVINPDDTFIERFHHEAFVDTGVSTTDIVTSSGYCYFDDGELYQSEIIALDNTTFSTAIVTVSGLATSNLSSSVSFDGGSSWEAVSSFGTAVTNGGSSTDGLTVRFIGSSDCDGSNTYLSKVNVQYT